MIKITFALLCAAAAFAQPGPSRVVSPEVLPDHRITFRISAPKATEVVLRLGDANPASHSMTKGEGGVWSVTLGPFEPAVYIYYFMLDGAKTIDSVEVTWPSGIVQTVKARPNATIEVGEKGKH